MSSKTTMAGRQVPLRMALVIAMAVLATSCSKDAPETATADPAAASAQAAAEQQQAAEAVAAMTPEQLREAASKAYQESRLYAPGGDNAMEYYLALREKQPADAGVSSALIDLLPMTVIATEQSRDREDFDEARRLLALIERADKSHPALERLSSTIATSEAGVARRVEQQQLTAEQEDQRRQQLERERLEQQRVAQEQAAQQLVQQQQAAEAEAARQQAAQQEAARQEAARQ
ncbi:energy transducer TonB, partial [Luteimonas aestuarii]